MAFYFLSRSNMGGMRGEDSNCITIQKTKSMKDGPCFQPGFCSWEHCRLAGRKYQRMKDGWLAWPRQKVTLITFPSSLGWILVLSHILVVEEARNSSCVSVRKRMDDQSRIPFTPPALGHHLYPPLGVSTLPARHVPLWSNGASKPLAKTLQQHAPVLSGCHLYCVSSGLFVL